MRKIVLRVLAVSVVTALAVGGFLLYRADKSTSYAGGSAADLAQALGCQRYQQKARASQLAQFHDQGTCVLGTSTVKVTTFADGGEQRAYTILMRTLVPAYTRRGGAYAEGDGWVVADDLGLSKEVAVRASNRLGGSVREFAAAAAPGPATP